MISSKSKSMIEITDAQRAALLGPPATLKDAIADAVGGSDALAAIREAFEETGYVVVRGLLGSDLLSGLEEAAQSVVDELAKNGQQAKTFKAVKFGPVFASSPRVSDSKENENKSPEAAIGWDDEQYFRKVALSSAVPRFIASVLLDLSPSSSLRVLKDAFLAKGSEEQHCGWHVDDFSFWPATATDPSPGINAWIALDDIKASNGGGMAVSPGSHKAEWRHEAYKIIGSTQVYPKGGFSNFKEMQEKAPGHTCTAISNSEGIYSTIEASKVLPDYRSGDVLFCKRWLFHRSVPINDEGQKLLDRMAASRLGRIPTFKRYTIRYEPGVSRLLEGVSIEASILTNPANSGQTLDDVCAEDGPWYPRCWPGADEEELINMRRLVEEKFPAAEEAKKELMNELMPLFTKAKEREAKEKDGGGAY